MTLADLEAVLHIQAQAYAPAFHEAHDVFAGRLARYPQHAWVVEDSQGLLAYLFAQPARHGQPPALHEHGMPAADHDSLHLHDMAVAPRARGRGLAQQLLQHALAVGRQERRHWATLVAVQNSAPYWRNQGFTDAVVAKSLSSYGADAAYLARPLLPRIQ